MLSQRVTITADTNAETVCCVVRLIWWRAYMAISLLSVFTSIRVIAVFVSSDAILLGKVAVDESQPASYGRLPANPRRARQARLASGQVGHTRANSRVLRDGLDAMA